MQAPAFIPPKQEKLPDPSEAVVSKAIECYLNAKRIYHDRMNSGRFEAVKRFPDKKTGMMKEYRNWILLAKKGTPDRWFLINGQMYFVEVKKKGKNPTPEQIERHAELQKHGAVIIVADSIDSFIKQFTQVTKKKGETK